MRTVAQINEKIADRTVKVCTIEELKSKVKKQGISKTYQEIDVVCTGTFEPMESSGAIINLGHTDPPPHQNSSVLARWSTYLCRIWGSGSVFGCNGTF